MSFGKTFAWGLGFSVGLSGNVRVISGLYKDNGKENRNHYLGFGIKGFEKLYAFVFGRCLGLV